MRKRRDLRAHGQPEAAPPRVGPSRERRIRLRGRLGTLAARRGEEARARAAEARLAAIDGPYLFGAPYLWRGGIAAPLGERERALARLGVGFSRANFGPWVHLDPDLRVLWDDPDLQVLAIPGATLVSNPGATWSDLRGEGAEAALESGVEER
ncbi:MAG: hypothetical protein P8188_16880 [Gemmatimonadota bacterium]